MNLANTIDIFNRHASEYHLKYGDVSMYSESLELVCELLKSDGKVLELCCGPGNVTSYLQHKRPDIQITATDLAPAMLVIARNSVPRAAFMLMDQRDLLSLNARFDGVVCAFDLPYLTNDETGRLVRDCFNVLNAGGILFLSTMICEKDEIRIMPPGKGNMQMHYYEEEKLIATLESSGFKIRDVRKISYSLPSNEPVTDIVLVAVKPGTETQ